LKKQGKFGVDAGAPVGGANLKIAPLPANPPEGARRAPDTSKSPPPFSNGIHHAPQRHDHINKFVLHSKVQAVAADAGHSRRYVIDITKSKTIRGSFTGPLTH